ncbi:hypothetical protein HYALB_00000937 [Hymenoscyphus albidus]|uniref:Uncharacterized protein n=1 Tax=Hymenoscyphus albidus TaxID=595503 RepID=A0A9N9LG37_9HELO|nr:hypothetical protein HYALB_00000937 [Hymenoscyphus albidus]
MLRTRSSTNYYLSLWGLHSFFYNSFPLTQKLPWSPNGPRNGGLLNTKDQWVTEVENIFLKGMLETILLLRQAARRDIMRDVEPSQYQELYAETLSQSGDKYTACPRILLRDSDHTKIHWIKFWITIVLLCLLCVSSYQISLLEQSTRNGFKQLLRYSGLFTKKAQIFLIALGRYFGQKVYNARLFPAVDRVREIPELESIRTARVALPDWA